MKKAKRLEYLDQLEKILNNETKREIHKRNCTNAQRKAWF